MACLIAYMLDTLQDAIICEISPAPPCGSCDHMPLISICSHAGSCPKFALPQHINKSASLLCTHHTPYALHPELMPDSCTGGSLRARGRLLLAGEADPPHQGCTPTQGWLHPLQIRGQAVCPTSEIYADSMTVWLWLPKASGMTYAVLAFVSARE